MISGERFVAKTYVISWGYPTETIYNTADYCLTPACMSPCAQQLNPQIIQYHLGYDIEFVISYVF